MKWFDSDHRPIVLNLDKDVKHTVYSRYEELYEIRSHNLIGRNLDKLTAQFEVEAKYYDFDERDGSVLWSNLQACIVKSLRALGLLRKRGKRFGKPLLTKSIRKLIHRRNEARRVGDEEK